MLFPLFSVQKAWPSFSWPPDQARTLPVHWQQATQRGAAQRSAAQRSRALGGPTPSQRRRSAHGGRLVRPHPR
jgi:hypothetical protein